MEDPLGSIKLQSTFQRPVRLSFDIVSDEDTINVTFADFPKIDAPWCGIFRSEKRGTSTIKLHVVGGRSAAAETIIFEVCKELGITNPKGILNIRRNYVDLHIPQLLELGPVAPNHPERDTVIRRAVGYVLFADLRGFSKWSLETEPEHVSAVYEVISDRVAQILSDYHFSYWKLLGDGIMLVWDGDDDEANAADSAIGAAYELHKKYWYFREESLYSVPEGFGIAIVGDSLTKFSSCTFFESCIVNDYLGPAVNFAARLQTLATPGQVLVNRRVKKVSKFDWYSFEPVSKQVQDDVEKLKGLSSSATEIYAIRHKHFSNDWENFCSR